MNLKARISRDGQKGMGCLLVVIGLVAAASSFSGPIEMTVSGRCASRPSSRAAATMGRGGPVACAARVSNSFAEASSPSS